MNASEFNRQITIEKKVITGKDSVYGTDIVGWARLLDQTVLGRCWAKIEESTQRSEMTVGGLVLAKNQMRVTIRYRGDVDSSMRVTLHGETDVVYQIVGGPSIVGGRKRYLELICEKYSS